MGKFQQYQDQYWRDKRNHLHFFKQVVAPQLSIQQPEDWYNVSKADIVNRGGSTLLDNYYGGSLMKALQFVYPNYHWDPTKFTRVNTRKKKLLAEKESQRRVFDRVGKQNAINRNQLGHWLTIEKAEIESHDAQLILDQFYNGSISQAVQSIYPEYDWKSAMDKKAEEEEQELQTNGNYSQRSLDTKANTINQEHLNHLHSISSTGDNTSSNKNKSSSTRAGFQYQREFSKAIQRLYPDYPWFWKEVENQRKFFDTLVQHLKLENYSQWYNYERSDISQISGNILLDYHYSGSLFSALETVYPEHLWHPWEFAKLPPLFWEEEANVKQYLQYLEKKHQLSSLEDWMALPSEIIHRGMRRREDGLMNALKKYYPQLAGKQSGSTSRVERGSVSKSQLFLYKVMIVLLPSTPYVIEILF